MFENQVECAEEDNDLEGDESLDYIPESSIDIYPAEIKIESEKFSVFELKRRYEDKGEIIMDPDFQRGFVWTTKQKRELIESILMGIKLPSFYFAENPNGKKIVVDGKQRLSTLFEFVNNRFSLLNLNIMQEQKGFFKDLDGNSQSKIEDYQVEVNTIKSPTPVRVMLDIFDRINRGGTTLNNQEMRNALYRGKSTVLLKELADSELFKKATDNSISSKRMKDMYVILRFLTFYLWKKELLCDKEGYFVDYKSDMNDFLAKAMECINEMDDSSINDLKIKFYVAMTNVRKVVPVDAFRLLPRPQEEMDILNKKTVKRPINMPLFESICYLLSNEIGDDKIYQLSQKYNNLINNPEYLQSITIQVDNIKSIKTRFDFVDEIKNEVLCD